MNKLVGENLPYKNIDALTSLSSLGMDLKEPFISSSSTFQSIMGIELEPKSGTLTQQSSNWPPSSRSVISTISSFQPEIDERVSAGLASKVPSCIDVWPPPGSIPLQNRISFRKGEQPGPGEVPELILYCENFKNEHATKPLFKLQEGSKEDYECQVHLRRPIPPVFEKYRNEYPQNVETVGTQTKDMTFLTSTIAQRVFIKIYPKPDEYCSPPQSSRKESLDAVVNKAKSPKDRPEDVSVEPKMTKYSSNKHILKPLEEDYFKEELFKTGSKFIGEYHKDYFLKGRYTHPTGVVLESEWKDGMFHNNKHKNIVIYPRGDKFEGNWVDGRMVDGEITFGDGLKYTPKKWKYCEGVDRRLKSEKYYGMKPAGAVSRGRNYMNKHVPEGCYDVGEGYYEPFSNYLRNFDGNLIRTPDATEREWILKYCKRYKLFCEDYFPYFSSTRFPGSTMDPLLKDPINEVNFVTDGCYSTRAKKLVKSRTIRPFKCPEK